MVNKEIQLAIALNEQSKIFRDMADQDYILARISFKQCFSRHFSYLSNQCVENYFKAILILNNFDFNTRKKSLRGHDLPEIFKVVEENYSFVTYDFPSELIEFLKYIRFDRYGDYSSWNNTFGKFEDRYYLDKVVWMLRRFTNFYLYEEIKPKSEYLYKLRSIDLLNKPKTFTIKDAFLEKYLDDNDSVKDLSVENMFFGSLSVNEPKINTAGKINTGRKNKPFSEMALKNLIGYFV